MGSTSLTTASMASKEGASVPVKKRQQLKQFSSVSNGTSRVERHDPFFLPNPLPALAPPTGTIFERIVDFDRVIGDEPVVPAFGVAGPAKECFHIA